MPQGWAFPGQPPQRASGPEYRGPPGFAPWHGACPPAFGALCTHPGLLPRCDSNLTFPAIASHISPDRRDQRLNLPTVPSGPMADGLPPSGAQALTKVEEMILALPKRTASQFTKMENENKKPSRLQSLWGGTPFLKGVYMP